MPTPKDQARENIAYLLTQAAWAVRNQNTANILAFRGVAIRNFTSNPRHGFADYALRSRPVFSFHRPERVAEWLQLDRNVVPPDQIRTVIRTYRDKLFTEIFSGRAEVPKTLNFAKGDRHAVDIARIVREEFGKGNDFAQTITCRTSGKEPEVLTATP